MSSYNAAMTMRRVSILVTTLFATALRAAEPNLSEEIDRYLAARTSLGQFSGVALVANRDGVVFRKAYGYANIELRVPNTIDTTFEIASLSKAFTAAAILMLRDEGKLKLDDSICRFTDPCPEAWKPITIKQLLHHTSGIPDYESALEMGSTKYADAMALSDAPQRLIDAARAKPLDFAPGSKFHYSNTGYLLLGFAIEKASGVSYAQYLQSKIFTPLQLTSTGVIDRTRIQKNRADGYTGDEEAPPERIYAGFSLLDGMMRRAIYTRLPSPSADGGLYSTAGDLDRWVTALDQGKLLSAAARAEMMTPQLGSYGTGWFSLERYGRSLRSHTGNLPGFVSVIDRYAGGELTVILLCNIDSGRIGRTASSIEAMAFHQPYDLPRSHKIIEVPPGSNAPLTGAYKTDDGRVVTISEGKRFLEATMPNEYTAGLLLEAPRQFYMPLGEGTFTFSAEPDHARTLTMHYNGKDIIAHRVE
jgi:CubicO group peptidase (beta-lactamase class C family)